jgi:phosphoribosylformimino-5-aminoimidazole carboxamide ribotide isomerase
MLLIPAIDLRGGFCVRLYQGDFTLETRYEADPLELAVAYQALGATWLHVVDLDGARDGIPANRVMIERLCSDTALSVQVGGGIRDREVIDKLLAAGVRRAVIGSLAIEQPALVRSWLGSFGPERICLAIDVRVDQSGRPVAQTRGWTAASAQTLWEVLGSYKHHGLRHVLCTDVARDGALSGPNIDLYREATERFPEIAWQASGGIRSAGDLAALRSTGVAAAISGKALLEKRISAEDLQTYLPNASSPVSTSATARS